MKRDLNNLKSNNYDLLVIGGGINGASIAHMGAQKGLKVALVEKGDFSGGTSSKSSKLLHGGIRYLENFDFQLVREALIERYVHLKAVPHLTKPVRFIIPVYKGDKRPLWMMKLGVFLYDCLAGKFLIKKNESLSAEEVMRREPSIKREGLKGGVIYYDVQMDDVRLCLENVLSAALEGAQIANYLEVVSILKKNQKACGVSVKDVLDPKGEVFQIRAKHIICAAGPWTNLLLKMDNPKAPNLVRTTKGVHIVYPKQISEFAFLVPTSDHRVFFVIPWKGNTLIGTTDTDFKDHPDRVQPEEADIEYLLKETKRVFPSLSIQRSDIKVAFAGLRPLLAENNGDHPSKVSREHSITQSDSGIWYAAGGKYTTYRKIAEDCLNKITQMKLSSEYPLYGSGKIPENKGELAQTYEVDEQVIQFLMDFYGTRFIDVLELTRVNPKYKERICPHSSYILAQLIYSVAQEMAMKPDDIIFRRLSCGYNACLMEECRQAFQQAVSEIDFCALTNP